MADCNAVRLSAGLSLLSNGTTSHLTPAGLYLLGPLNFSAKNWKLRTWLEPTGAIRPDSGSIQAILTVCPANGAAPAAWACSRLA